MKILVVEDEYKLADILSTYLQAAGYQVKCLDNGMAVLATVNEWQADMVLLDLMLPGKDGLEVCKELRAESDIPIIMVTAKTEEIDRLLGLELGADDYICKPYSPREVVARVKAVLRRANADSNTDKNSLQINIDKFEAIYFGNKLDLTPVEFRLLALLASQPGRIYSRDQLLSGIYQDHRVVTDRAVDSHIKNLRRKLAQIKADIDPIRSVYSMGYSFENP